MRKAERQVEEDDTVKECHQYTEDVACKLRKGMTPKGWMVRLLQERAALVCEGARVKGGERGTETHTHTYRERGEERERERERGRGRGRGREEGSVKDIHHIRLSVRMSE